MIVKRGPARRRLLDDRRLSAKHGGERTHCEGNRYRIGPGRNLCYRPRLRIWTIALWHKDREAFQCDTHITDDRVPGRSSRGLVGVIGGVDQASAGRQDGPGDM